MWGHELVTTIALGSGTRQDTNQDALSSMRATVDGSGNEVGSATYDVYGAVRQSAGTPPWFRFNGQQTDPETGLVYAGRGRYDDSVTAGAVRRTIQSELSTPQGRYYDSVTAGVVRLTAPVVGAISSRGGVASAAARALLARS